MRQISFRAWVPNETQTLHKMITVTKLDFMKNADGSIDTESEVSKY